MRFLTVWLCGVILIGLTTAAAAKDPVTGLWLTEGGDAVVELYDCPPKICGRFHWTANTPDGHKALDIHNPDAAKRGTPLCHMQFLADFEPDGQGGYNNGSIYNPKDGGDYSADMVLKDHDTLSLHGYLVLPILGQSQIWTRVQSYPDCAGDKP